MVELDFENKQNMTRIGKTFGQELFAAGCSDGVSWNTETGELTFSAHRGPSGDIVDSLSDDQYAARIAAAQRVLAAHDPMRTPPSPAPYLTGRDVVDGMSPDQAKAADTADPRNLARVSAAIRASEVKSCIGRIARAAGLTAEALLAQATPTGGT